MRAFLLLLFPCAALAQHDHAAVMPGASGKPVAAVVKPGESAAEAAQHGIPLGNGPSADGQCWLIILKTGAYRILNAPVQRDNTGNEQMFRAGSIVRIGAHKGPLIWVKPGDTEPSQVPLELQVAINPEHLAR